MSKVRRELILVTAVLAALMLVVLLLISCAGGGTAESRGLRAVQHTFQSGVVTNTNGTAMDVSQLPKIGVQVEGIVTATVTFEATIDNDTWYAVEAVNRNNGSKATSTASDGIFSISVAEFKMLRCPVSSWTSGTITVRAIGLDGGIADPADVAVSDITTGTVDVANVVSVDATGQGDVPITLGGEQVDAGKAAPVVTYTTGSAAVNMLYAPGSDFWLESVTLNLSVAPTTSQNFTIMLDAGAGAAYDTLLYSGDLSAIGGGTTDLLWQPEGMFLCDSTDAISVTWANSDSRTYGLRLVVRLAE